jgi:hypothetical protein
MVNSVGCLLPIYSGVKDACSELELRGMTQLNLAVSALTLSNRAFGIEEVGLLFGLMSLNCSEMAIGRRRLLSENTKNMYLESLAFLDRVASRKEQPDTEDGNLPFHVWVVGWCVSLTHVSAAADDVNETLGYPYVMRILQRLLALPELAEV